MKKYPTILIGACLCSFLLVSCDDNQALSKKNHLQKLEIARLEGEKALLTEQLIDFPADQTQVLGEMTAKAGLQKQEMETMEQEIVRLEEKKNTLQEEFELYKKNYRIE